MNKRQAATLAAIFAEPTRANIDWHDIESLLLALGAEISEGRGSRVRVLLSGVRRVFHRPHPASEAGKPLVRDLRRFLGEAGVESPG